MVTDSALRAGAVRLPRRRSLALNSAGLVAGKAVQMGTGYLFWLVAARTVSVHEVGVAAAAVSAVMLCTQLGLLGSGAASIVMLGRDRAPVSEILGSALAVVTTASAAVAVVCLMAIGGLSDSLHVVASDRWFAGLFVLAAVFGTVIICFDQVSVALARGDQVLPRYLVSGTLSVALLLVAGVRSTSLAAGAVFACWAVDATISSLVGWYQTRRWLGRWVRPRFTAAPARELLRLGLPNHALTLTERAPALLVPVLTAVVASPTITAGWYPAWMMAWVAYTAPVAVGLAQFSDIVRRPDRIRETTVAALRWSLLLGGSIAVVLVIGARPLLSILGREYAESSTGALRLLAVGVVPYAVVQAYNSVCRARQRLAEATATGLILGGAACTATVVVADRGTTMMAAAWVTVFTLGAAWCGTRLLNMIRERPPLVLLTATH